MVYWRPHKVYSIDGISYTIYHLGLLTQINKRKELNSRDKTIGSLQKVNEKLVEELLEIKTSRIVKNTYNVNEINIVQPENSVKKGKR